MLTQIFDSSLIHLGDDRLQFKPASQQPNMFFFHKLILLSHNWPKRTSTHLDNFLFNGWLLPRAIFLRNDSYLHNYINIMPILFVSYTERLNLTPFFRWWNDEIRNSVLARKNQWTMELKFVSSNDDVIRLEPMKFFFCLFFSFQMKWFVYLTELWIF